MRRKHMVVAALVAACEQEHLDHLRATTGVAVDAQTLQELVAGLDRRG
ncbi:hypothetical protein [Cellulomonas sp. NS3]|nr:hypothetical protein [Cellulomonas sp. NS3]